MVHTGQHYDDDMSRVFFDELGLPRPEHRLDLGGGTNTDADRAHARRGRRRCCAPRRRTRCSSTATRTRRSPARSPPRRRACPVAHVEAGMRSFDRAMPEELNRVLTDHASDLLLCPSRGAGRATCAPSASRGRIEVVGDVMVDVAQLVGPRAPRRRARGLRRSSPRTAPATSTTRRGCAQLVDLLLARPGAGRLPAAPAHPRAARGAPACSTALAAGVELLPPLGYLEFTALRPPRARGAHRLRRRAEGGLPRRRPLRHAARHDGVDGDGRRRLEHARRPRRRARARRARAPAAARSARRSTATAAPASASSRPS